MWIVRDEDNTLWLFTLEKPYKKYLYDENYWDTNTGCGGGVVVLDSNLFPEITWNDKEPAEVELILKK